MVVGVVYRTKMRDEMPGIFRNPVAPDSQAYAQAMYFVPKRRLIKAWVTRGGSSPPPAPPPWGGQTGVPGQRLSLPPRPSRRPPPRGGLGELSPVEHYFIVRRQNKSYHPEVWSLVHQNWTTQLVPATCPNIPVILSQLPDGLELSEFQPPDLRGITIDDFLWVSNH
jgi:hypothetical protein